MNRTHENHASRTRGPATLCFWVGVLAACALGQVPLAPGSLVVTGWDHPGSNVTIFNGRTDPALVLGPGNSAVNLYKSGGTPPYAWDRPALGGSVFGVAIDRRQNIYVASSTVYGDPFLTIPAFISTTTAGTVYRIRGGKGNLAGISVPTGLPEAFAVIPNAGAGLGNLAYDAKNDRLYVTNLDDGRIYFVDKISTTAAVATSIVAYDHGAIGLPMEGRPAVNDDGSPSFTQLGRRVWAAAVRDGRLFYSTWREDEARPSVSEANEIWSVALNPNGAATANTARLELALPKFGSNNWSNPVSDIHFAPSGSTMFVAERVRKADMGFGDFTDAHRARLLEYHFVKKANGKYAWMASPITKFLVGTVLTGENAAGGVTVFYDGRPWATGDYMNWGGNFVYGVEGFPFAGSASVIPWSSNCYVVDTNGTTAAHDKTQIGSVRCYDPCLDVHPVPTGLVVNGATTGVVNAILRVNDCWGQRLYVAGSFTSIGGVVARNVAVWDGSAWSALGEGTNAPVYALAMHDDGSGRKLYAGGSFRKAGNVLANMVARWDGSSWSAVGGAQGTLCGPSVRALASFAANGASELYAAGEIRLLNPSTPVPHPTGIARWNGSEWNDVGGGLIDSAGPPTPGCPAPLPGAGAGYCLEVFDDGAGPNLYVGGRFDYLSTTMGAIAAPCMGRWNGTAWVPTSTASPCSGTIHSLRGANTAIGSRMLAGGAFTAGGVSNVGAYHWVSGAWSPLGAGVDAPVRGLGLVTDDDGIHVYATGEFLNAGGAPASRFARFDGENWVPVQATTGTGPIALDAPGHVIHVPEHEGSGAFYVGGKFISIDDGATATGPVALLGPCCPDIFITGGPVSSNATLNGTHTFSVTATSANPLTYQWKKNGQDIPGATLSSYTFTVTASDFFPTEFSVCVSNGCATIVACPVSLSQAAIWDTGSPCCTGGSEPPPVLTLSSAMIGTNFTITVSPVPPGASVGIYISAGGYPPINLCGCDLYIDLLNHTHVPTVAGSNGTATLSGVVPNLPGYHGVMQAVVYYPNCVPPVPCVIPGCFCVSNAVEFIIG
jgi:hypothetical protein